MSTEPTSMRPRDESGSLGPLTYNGVPVMYQPTLSGEQYRNLILKSRRRHGTITNRPGDQEMSQETLRCPVCTANYNPITNMDHCPHRQYSHTLIDPPEEAPEIEGVFDAHPAAEEGKKSGLEVVLGGLMDGSMFKDEPQDETQPAPIEIPAPGRIVYIKSRTETDTIDEAVFVAPAIVVASKGYTNLEPVQHGTTILLRRMDDAQRDIGCMDPVSLFQHISEAKTPGALGWDWMPYQKGQAKKLEEVQSIEWMGLRTSPSIEDLERRFTYHPPTTEEKIQAYQSIRSRAEDLASLLVLYCPPSPELASALDHLDTVVFKANASIARHG